MLGFDADALSHPFPRRRLAPRYARPRHTAPSTGDAKGPSQYAVPIHAEWDATGFEHTNYTRDTRRICSTYNVYFSPCCSLSRRTVTGH